MEVGHRFIEGGDADRIEYESLLPLWEESRRENPDDLMTLAWLGHAYTRLGRFEDGLSIDRKLVELCPDDPTIRYNLACSLSLTGRTDDAFAALERALALGYRDSDQLVADPDLAPIRGDPRFPEIVRRLGRAGA